MKFNYLFLIVIAAGFSGCSNKNVKPAQEHVKTQAPVQAQTTQHTGTGTLVIKPITFKKGSYIRDAVKNECNLEGKLSQFIEKSASSQYANILINSTSSSNPRHKKTQILTVVIEEAQGGGGGAWSGAKAVSVKGKLTQGGRVLGDFKARRYSGGGMFGAYKGTCAILGRCVRTLGKDIASWLQNPTSQAVLGDM